MIRFDRDFSPFIEELRALIATQRARIETLLLMEPTYHTLIKPMDQMDEELEQFFAPLSHLNAVANTPQTQAIYAEAIEILTEYSTSIAQHLPLYHATKAIKEREYLHLTTAQRRMIDLSLRHFELSGAHLDTSRKKRLAQIELRLSQLSTDFAQNLLNATNAYEKIITDPRDVEGISEEDLIRTDEGHYRFTLQLPSYIAYMTYGPNRAIREELYRAYTTRAPHNSVIIDEILSLRQEYAQLIGYESYAHYSLASKIAPSPHYVITFLEQLLTIATPLAHAEVAQMREHFGEDLSSYDWAYYSEKLKKELYDLDEEAYRPYFPLDGVLEGTLHFVQELFGVQFTPLDTPLYHLDARAYRLHDGAHEYGTLILDLNARESKRGGAWMDSIQTHYHHDEIEYPASAIIVANFPPASLSTPALLRHDDVVTLFHEMGHALHHLLSRVEERGVSGVHGVEWDGVEFPSQLLENFAYAPEVLRLFARHHESGELLSEPMIERLTAAKNFQSATALLRQLEFSLFDMHIHLHAYHGEALQALLDTLRERTALITPPRYNRFQNGFSHIFSGGYAAGYYSYKYAEVLSADVYEQILREGIFSSPTAQTYKHLILERGGSQSMHALFVELMGRESDVGALLRLHGMDA